MTKTSYLKNSAVYDVITAYCGQVCDRYGVNRAYKVNVMFSLERIESDKVSSFTSFRVEGLFHLVILFDVRLNHI